MKAVPMLSRIANWDWPPEATDALHGALGGAVDPSLPRFSETVIMQKILTPEGEVGARRICFTMA